MSDEELAMRGRSFQAGWTCRKCKGPEGHKLSMFSTGNEDAEGLAHGSRKHWEIIQIGGS